MKLYHSTGTSVGGVLGVGNRSVEARGGNEKMPTNRCQMFVEHVWSGRPKKDSRPRAKVRLDKGAIGPEVLG
jgi:hypothetical protein